MTPSPDIQTPLAQRIEESDARVGALFTAAHAEEFGPLNPRPHPFLPSPTRVEIDEAMSTPEKAAEYLAWYQNREKLIHKSEQPGQMIRYAFELDCWKDADRDLSAAKTEGRNYGGQYVGGGKRSTKSSWAASRVVQSALTYGEGIIWCHQREMNISKITQQRMIWAWLPQVIRDKNDVAGKRKGGDATKIRYTLDGGFTEGTVVLPNATMLMFLSYKMDPKDYQGAEIGARLSPRTTAKPGFWPWIDRVDGNGVAYYANGLPVPNIGEWLDEDASLAWVSTCLDRLTTRNAKLIWTFTTEKGITRAVKETLGTATNIETRPADDMLPQDRVLVRGCPPGHVPYRQKTGTPGVNAIFFHTRFNKFGDNYANMSARYRGKDEKIVLPNIYGHSDDVYERVYPLFGPWNVIDEDELPAEGTNYLFGDPAGARNWAWQWWRICPGYGGKEDWYLIDEWPDEQRYGAWAMADESSDPNPDGVAGPAQQTLSWGVERYKQMILERERIIVPEEFATEAQRRREGDELSGVDSEQHGQACMPHLSVPLRLCGLTDPMRIKLARAAFASEQPTTQLPTKDRYLDPRAAATAKEQQKGARTLLDLFREETRDAAGNITGPRMNFLAAPGLDIEIGVSRVQQLLFFDDKQPVVRGLNAPRLFVVRKCRQTIWMFENYTSKGGESGGCKDFADLTRYAATSRLRYIAPGMAKTIGGMHRDEK